MAEMRFLLDDADYTYKDPHVPMGAIHVVLTRFNMVLPSFREVGELQSDTDFAKWLENRIPIFRSLCLASLVRQIKPPDAWLIGFDGEHPDRVAEVIKMIAPHPWILPIWQKRVSGEYENARALFAREIAALLRPEHKYVLTSRIDNDDAMSRGYCLAAQQFASGIIERGQGPKEFWISFPLGSQLSGDVLRLFPQNNNAFLSRCELAAAYRGGKGSTVLSSNHGHVFEKGKVYAPMSRSPMWLQFVHEGNVSNSEKKHLLALADLASELRRFGIDERAVRKLTTSTTPPSVDQLIAGIEPALTSEPVPTERASIDEETSTAPLPPSLDDLGLSHGTDKASSNHRYLDTYERYLVKFRNSAVNVLELGIVDGASLRMWRDYFPKGRIVGADGNAERLMHAGERIEVVIGNCGDPTFLASIVEGRGQFELIIDDASHWWQHQQTAFETLFSAVAPGGMFIIEDIHTSYHERYGRGWAKTTVEWLKEKIDLVVADRIDPDRLAQDRMWRNDVNEIVLLRKSCIIVKR